MHPDEMIEILHLNDNYICDSAALVPLLLKTDFQTLAQPLVDSMYQTLQEYIQYLDQQNPHMKTADVKLALLILLMTSGLKNQINTKATNSLQAYELSFLKLLLMVMDHTGKQLPFIMQSGYCCTEIAILIFIRHFFCIKPFFTVKIELPSIDN